MNSTRISFTYSFSAFVLLGALALTGCGGGQQIGGTQSGLNGDIAPGYGSSIATANRKPGQGSAFNRGAYPMIETSFQLGSVPGDPFDYEKVSVLVALKKADGNTINVPAFFDGGNTWRMRYTPTAPGPIGVVEIKLNGATVHESKLEKKDWQVSGTPKPGFVHLDTGNHAQFAYDNGDKFFPIGHNVAWLSDPKITYDAVFGKMHAAGENWSSVWLDQRDGKNLDAAVQDGKTRAGQIDLEQAKKWDSIVSAADKSDIYFQLVVENSGAFSSASGFPDSSNNHAAWDKNPLNPANGGTLKSPDAFFNDPTARTLEKRKLYYILARWGYSPNIMGIQLFHDVQNTDAAFGKRWDDIATWHREMALFLKNADANRHLITTGSAPGVALDSPIWETVDYVQSQVYGSDVLTALTSPAASPPTGKKLNKPFMVTEFGATGDSDAEGAQLHTGLWAGLMSGASGGAQYWDWDNADKQNLYDSFKSASAFVTASSLAEHPGMPGDSLKIETTQRGALTFGPGTVGRADAGSPTEFVVGSSGPPPGIDRLSNILAGGKALTFQVSYPQAGTFAVTLGQVSHAGAELKVAMDGKGVERLLPESKEDHAVPADSQTLRLEVPAGSHTVTVQNTGADWVTLRKFALSNYSSALAGVGRASKDYEIAWIYNRDGVDLSETAAKSVTPAAGTVKLPGLQKGKYIVTWWDTHAGKSIDTSDLNITNAKDEIALTVPPTTRDVALYVIKAGTEKAKLAKQKGARTPGNGVQAGGQVNPTNFQQPGAAPANNNLTPLGIPGRTQ